LQKNYILEKVIRRSDLEMINGIFETHINVLNFEESSDFYKRLPGISPLYKDEDRKSTFFWVGGEGKGMLGIRENYPSKDVQRQHFAILVDLDNLKKTAIEVKKLGISIHNFFEDDSGELYVFPFMPAVSFYFKDPNGHSVEYISMLNDKPLPDKPIIKWSEWEKINGRLPRDIF
jgi:lactoylglutathione lyase